MDAYFFGGRGVLASEGFARSLIKSSTIFFCAARSAGVCFASRSRVRPNASSCSSCAVNPLVLLILHSFERGVERRVRDTYRAGQRLCGAA
jgi:hypothetical protein